MIVSIDMIYVCFFLLFSEEILSLESLTKLRTTTDLLITHNGPEFFYLDSSNKLLELCAPQRQAALPDSRVTATLLMFGHTRETFLTNDGGRRIYR